MVKIILASKSSIRKQMLKEAGLSFEVFVSNADETPDLSKSFEEQLKEISLRKAKAVFEATIDNGKRVIVSADQNIVFNNIMYGKPKDLDTARELITSMKGNNNIYSYVGNSIIYADGDRVIKMINNCDIARMCMDNITSEELEDYLINNNPLSKCGGINIVDTNFLHLEEGKMSTASGMTIEFLQELLSSL